jgi:hypothetical protein
VIAHWDDVEPFHSKLTPMGGDWYVGVKRIKISFRGVGLVARLEHLDYSDGEAQP